MFTLITVWAMGIFFILYMGTSILSTYPQPVDSNFAILTNLIFS